MKRWVILDTPFIASKVIPLMNFADYGVLVVSAKKGEFDMGIDEDG